MVHDINNKTKTWRQLSPLQIRLTKAALLLGDVLAFVLAALLAATLSQAWGDGQDGHWLVTQDLQRYWAWLGVVS